jgi:mono/diheme cytochrome c family protein
MKTWLVLSGAAVAVGALGWLVLTAGPGASIGDDHTPDLARGAALYAEACAACHGADLEGEPDWRERKPDGRLPAPPHDATGHTWHHPDRVLMEITLRGTAAVVGGGYESDMPGFGGIYSEDELRDVLEWIKTQWPERERAHQARLTAQDEATR